MNCAVGSSDGQIELGLPEGGNEGMYAVNVGNTSFTVPVRRLDDIVNDHSLVSIDLIKIDIEGSELLALTGAVKTLRQYEPAIIIELNHVALARCNTSPAEVVGFMEGLGYDGWVITETGLRAISPRDRHECDECLFLSAKDNRRDTLLG